MVSESKLGYALLKADESLKIKEKTFVLMLIKQRHFLEGAPDKLAINVDIAQILASGENILSI